MSTISNLAESAVLGAVGDTVSRHVLSPDDQAEVEGVSRQQLRSIVERIERLEEEKRALAEDIKEVYSEAKANGYDTKTLRKVVSLRKKDKQERQEEEALLETYLAALGM